MDSQQDDSVHSGGPTRRYSWEQFGRSLDSWGLSNERSVHGLLGRRLSGESRGEAGHRLSSDARKRSHDAERVGVGRGKSKRGRGFGHRLGSPFRAGKQIGQQTM